MTYIKDPIKKSKYKEALENEKLTLQKLINDMNINETIKDMKFMFSKKYHTRNVTLIFKSKYTSIHGNRVNRWVGVEMLSRCELNLKDTNMIHWNPCAVSGTVYNNEYWEDGAKIAELLKNRYWIWLKHIDRLIKNDIEYRVKLNDVHSDWPTNIFSVDYAVEIDKTYQAAKYACNEISIPIRDAVNLYNEQVESGLIYDTEYGIIDYPESHVLEEHPIEDFQQKMDDINCSHFNGYVHRILG